MALISFLFLSFLLYLIRSFWRLRAIPGPFLAKFTDIWRLCIVWGRQPHLRLIELHERYGDLVRLGPTCVSVSMPDIVPILYGFGSGGLPKASSGQSRTLVLC